ncbi:MAG: Gfo/Idh/MocA family oxidoreductase [Longimicrobiales bacterium]|nr:Gfo/Idh/MocA family oxidoreductase [Longimicrobiales bacterium]
MKGGAIAFVGCGRAADTHSRVLRRIARGRDLRYASSSTPRAEAAARRWGGRALAGYDEAFDAPDVEIVVVTTPPVLHAPLALRALRAGRHVVVEKPAFLHPDEFRSVRAAAREADRRVAVAENYYYKPLRRTLTALIDQNELGDLLLVRLNAVKRQEAGGWRDDPAVAGGGALFEGGIHWVNLITNLGLDVASVRGSRAHPESRTDDSRSAEETWSITFDFTSGAVGVLDFSWQVPTLLGGVRLSTLYGTGGTAWFESNGLVLARRTGLVRVTLPGFRDLGGFRAMWRDFLDAFAAEREPAMTLDLAERDVRLVRHLYDQASSAP